MLYKFFMQISQLVNLAYFYSLRYGSASNWSNSVVSGRSNRPCECEIHNAMKVEYGTYLHPNDLPQSQTNNLPCRCSWVKWIFINKTRLDKDKLRRIKKRLRKAFEKYSSSSCQLNSMNDEGNPPKVSKSKLPSNDMNLNEISNLCSFAFLLEAAQHNEDDNSGNF